MSFSNLPSFNELPDFNKELKGCAWEVWGKGDQLGAVNLLTPEVVQRAASEEIKTGRSVCLNWPINFPAKPLYHRKAAEHKIISRTKIPRPATNDDELHINTQSGTQWDGLKHFGIFSAEVFYQGQKLLTILFWILTSEGLSSSSIPAADVKRGQMFINDPLNIDPELVKLGIHNWAQHGICGRGVLIDLVKFYTESGSKQLPYDPWTSHSISVNDIQAAAKSQGVEFRQGDILLLRVGFTQRYNASSQEEKDALPSEETFAGIAQGTETKQFLWDNHFAAVASDQPAFECWPPVEDELHLHQTIIGLWGMPIGEFFDLEALSKIAEETGRYTFFFSSWPLNILGGCASPPNAAAFF